MKVNGGLIVAVIWLSAALGAGCRLGASRTQEGVGDGMSGHRMAGDVPPKSATKKDVPGALGRERYVVEEMAEKVGGIVADSSIYAPKTFFECGDGEAFVRLYATWPRGVSSKGEDEQPVWRLRRVKRLSKRASVEWDVPLAARSRTAPAAQGTLAAYLSRLSNPYYYPNGLAVIDTKSKPGKLVCGSTRGYAWYQVDPVNGLVYGFVDKDGNDVEAHGADERRDGKPDALPISDVEERTMMNDQESADRKG